MKNFQFQTNSVSKKKNLVGRLGVYFGAEGLAYEGSWFLVAGEGGHSKGRKCCFSISLLILVRLTDSLALSLVIWQFLFQSKENELLAILM